MSTDFARTLRRLAHGSAAPQRRAAIELHAMPEADRQWILRQLTDVQRTTLGALLQELADLEAADAAEAPTIAPESSPATKLVPGDKAPTADWAVIDALDVRQVCTLLDAEPDAFRADVLIQGPFRWQAALPAGALPNAGGTPIDPSLSAPSPEPGARRLSVVLEELARQAQSPPAIPTQGTPTWRARVRRALAPLRAIAT